MVINGYTLEQFQRCKRPQAIGRTHRLSRWFPPSLLSAVLRMSVFNLSNGMDKTIATNLAVNGFLGEARNPGLDVGGIDTYTLSMDFVAIIKNVLEYLSRLSLLTLREVTPVSLSPSLSWQFLSHIDEAGALHRWKFVDYIPEDILEYLHSWEVFGDIAAADAPMTLHLVAIGQRRKSHQNIQWCKVYAHPKVARVYKFKKKGGGQLTEGWRELWFSERTENNPKEWVDLMIRDGVIGDLVRHISVKELSPQHIESWEKQVRTEAQQMEHYADIQPREIPMSRYACDKPYTCPHQNFCYSSLKLDDVGIYVRRSKEDKKDAAPVAALVG